MRKSGPQEIGAWAVTAGALRTPEQEGSPPMFSKSSFIAIAAAALGVATPGFAQSAVVEVSSKVVRYDDLNLADARGRERLETRVRTAANAVCGTREALTLEEKQAALACRNSAIASTKPQVAAAVLRAGPRLAVRMAE